MRTAIDSSVMWCLVKRQPGWEKWKQLLNKTAQEGQLLMCPVAFAECTGGFTNWHKALEKFQDIQIQYDPIGPDSAYLAGQIFRNYRKNNGPREHLLPDFLIGAHALCQADQLAALDRGYLRTYFPTLTLLSPSA